MEQKKYQESLGSRTKQFIDEAIETRRFSIKRAAGYHFELMGSTIPFIHVGYVRFLKGLRKRKLLRRWIGRIACRVHLKNAVPP